MGKIVKLFVLNSKNSDPNGYIFQALIRALGRRTDIQLHVVRGSDLKQIPIDPSNQSLLVYGGEELHQIPEEHLKRPFGRRAVWFTEDPYEVRRNQASARLFQAVFTNDSGSLEAYRAASYLPLAADPNFIPKRPYCEQENLLFFSGTAWPNRKKLLNTLLERWPNSETFDFHLVSNTFVEQQLCLQSSHYHLRFEEPISISDFCLRASNSLCTLVVGRDFSGSGQHCYARSPGPRLFEAGITGSCQLVHAEEIPDMPLGLIEGQHYLRFSTAEQLIDLLRQAQINPEPFREIGFALASEIQSRHTYEQRAALLVESLQQCKPEEAISTEPLSRLRVLFISHEQTKPGFQHGGAGLCLDQIVEAAPDDVDVRILCRSGDDGHCFIIFDRYRKRVGGFRCSQIVNEFTLHHPELEDFIQSVLAEWQPHLVHVNHLLGFTPKILLLARNAGARTLITLHDYYAICDSWNLLDNLHRFCGINQFFDDRCLACCTSRRPQFRSVDPIRRRVVIADALAQVQAVIVPSLAAKSQLLAVLPHLPAMHVIEPVFNQSTLNLSPGRGSDLIVLIPGNLSINKGFLELRRIIRQINDLGLPVKFHILGRVEAWIEKELASIANVKMLGIYDNLSFAAKASGADLALFLSPWPETYCITFDEWKRCGRACFFYSIGALAESHRHKGLHQASACFAPEDFDGLMSALIQATTPAGLRRLREPSSEVNQCTLGPDFADQHWSLYRHILNQSTHLSAISDSPSTIQSWVDENLNSPCPTKRQRLKTFVYSLPAGYKLVALLRRLFGR